jgi:toxin-antitoxin system PIN domain toxin
MHLLDVNVLIALIDENHTHHHLVVDWFIQEHRLGWATCPIVENGFIRIVGHANYPGGPKSTLAARSLLAKLCQYPGHQFWPDSISLLGSDEGPAELPGLKHLTDYYLLKLAIINGSKLASLDRRIDTQKIRGGEDGLALIQAS